eukprot:tig00000507_g1775.t1
MSEEELAPADNREYARKEYWEARYQKQMIGEDAGAQLYEWFGSLKFDDFREIVEKHLRPYGAAARILHLGCGNSALGDQLYEAGYKSVVNLDFSEVCIERMARLYAHRPEMTWVVGDVLDLRGFADGSFDFAIEKGTMDALITEEGEKWSPSEHVAATAQRMASEAARVLRPGGAYMMITFSQPHFRKRFLEPSFAKVETVKLGSGFHYYIYICTK